MFCIIMYLLDGGGIGRCGPSAGTQGLVFLGSVWDRVSWDLALGLETWGQPHITVDCIDAGREPPDEI